MGMKPLVFLHPLSERLNELKNSVEETAEAENIEIFELETLEEFSEVAPHLGQFLALCSNPKVCAKMLQLNSHLIRKEESKVILLSAKQFPHKTIDRLNKLGLTDFILESVAAKTLQYKVKLQMRSITVKEDVSESVIVKSEEVEEENKEKVEESQDQEESYYKKKKPKEDLEKAKAAEEEEKMIILQKKILADEEKNEKENSDKESFNPDEELDPNEPVSLTSSKDLNEEDNKVEGRRSKSRVSAFNEDNKASGTDKIDNVWSSQSNNGAGFNEENNSDLDGKSSTDKLSNDQKGKIKSKEKSISTHWGGNVDKTKKSDGILKLDSESLNNKSNGHYAGEVKSNDAMNQDFNTAETNFEERKKNGLVGESNAEKKKGLLHGSTENKSIAHNDLQTQSDGTDSLGNNLDGANLADDANKNGKMLGEGKTNNINDELNAQFEEDRSHKAQDEMAQNEDDQKLNHDDLAAKSLMDKSKKDPMSAASESDKLKNNLTNALKSSDDSQAGHMTGSVSNAEVEKKKKDNALMNKINEARKSKTDEKQDGYLRSPSAKKDALKNEIDPKKEKSDSSPIAEAEEAQDSSTDHDNAADVLDDFNNEGSTDIENADNLSGENTKEDELSDNEGKAKNDDIEDELSGESETDKIVDEEVNGETAYTDGIGDTWENNNKQAKLDIEVAEEEKKKKRLEELYALREKKLKEIEDKKNKRKAALASEEDLYKKERNWDDNNFSMDNKKDEHEEGDTKAAASKEKKGGQQNLEAVHHEKHNGMNSQAGETKTKHAHEEVQIDEADLSDMERELINSHKDWGEQVIDYKKIRAGMNGTTITRSGDDGSSELNISEREIEKEEKIYNGAGFEGDLDSSEEVNEGDTIIEADSKGLESIITILNNYLDIDIMPSDVLSKVAELANKESGYGVVSFFYKGHDTTEFSEILNGHSIYSSDERFNEWEATKHQNIPIWSSQNLPYWSDKRFEDKNIFFVYPFYEGIDHMGFAIVNFSNGINEEDSTRIEITLEAARAVYLSQRHKENGEEAIYNERKALPKLEEIKVAKEVKEQVSVPELEKPRGFMGGGDNLILLEKRKAEAEKEKEIEKKKKDANPAKKIWKRMFG